MSTLAGQIASYADGVGSAASFKNPYGVAVDTAGRLLVSDMGNSRIRSMSSAGLACIRTF